ncbi:MAG: GTP 3',8-cyclase MoaA [Myxococcota bacterium]
MRLQVLQGPGRLADPAGRTLHYLRLSVTDACNFRCVYCLPNGYQKGGWNEEPLSTDEIRHLVSGLAELGVFKVRLTGGEPTVRRDIVEVVRAVAGVPGIRTVALSTNAWRLRKLAKPLVEAGLHSVNISLDSLDPAAFHQITGQDRLHHVLAGIDAAIAAGLRVKLNAVLLETVLAERPRVLDAFLAYVRTRPVVARFIELMRTGGNAAFFERNHVDLEGVRARLLRDGWELRARRDGDGPAEEYVHPDSVGGVGLIAPYRKDFCASCNRLRVTSRGELRLCLFGEGNHPLRPLLADASSRDALVREVQRLTFAKPPAHRLHEGRTGGALNLSLMGG